MYMHTHIYIILYISSLYYQIYVCISIYKHTYINIHAQTYEQSGSNLHVDPVHTSAWNTLISGRYMHTYIHLHVVFIKKLYTFVVIT